MSQRLSPKEASELLVELDRLQRTKLWPYMLGVLTQEGTVRVNHLIHAALAEHLDMERGVVRGIGIARGLLSGMLPELKKMAKEPGEDDDSDHR